jgi:hypothetical protein
VFGTGFGFWGIGFTGGGILAIAIAKKVSITETGNKTDLKLFIVDEIIMKKV